MPQYSRIPALLTLVAVLTPGTFLVLSRHSDAATGKSSQLIVLQAAIARPGATPANWLAYAGALEELNRFDQAAWAYQHLLETEPLNRQARLQCASCLARSGRKNDLFSFISATIACDPKLAVEILLRPETQTYLTDPRFPALQREATAQSMD